MVDNPITRKEKYLAKLTGSYTGNIPDPITRVEKYLYDLCQKGISGLTPEEIENAVNKYLKENPVQPGATTEQAQQIEQNKVDIASLKTETSSLKEDLTNKITKFYASSQGETHLADSDNGKVQDMMIYGKSSQDGTPTPENPVEIKSVVNPTVKVCGKNLLNPTLESTTKKGITCTNNGDGTYTLNGTANGGSDTTVSFNVGYTLAKSGRYIVTGCPNGGSNEKYNLRIGKDNIPWGTYVNSDLGNGCLINVTDNTPITLNLMIKDGYTCNNVIFKPMIADASLYPDTTYDDFEPYHEQTVTLLYTLNAIPVSSGGNVTIDGQQYIADYVDVERGKLVRMCKEYVITGSERLAMYWLGNASYLRNVCCINNFENIVLYDGINPLAMSDMFIGKISENADDERAIYLMLRGSGDKTLAIKFLDSDGITTVDLAKQWLIEHKPKTVFVLSTPEEIDLTSEEITAFKALVTYYPTTNISVNSEQLDGYTVFNYPISMENGWNYVKQQIGDTRDYIYDMDIQSAEAYVNSEYAVALTELEV